MRAINNGDALALERAIGPGPLGAQGFQWVSTSTSSEYTPAGARRLLLRHSQQGERWTLVSVSATVGPSWHGGVDAEVHFERQMADGQVIKTHGKTALSCVGSAVYVLSLGDE